MFEMLIGYPPVRNTSGTYKKIVEWRDSLEFPPEVQIFKLTKKAIRMYA